MLYKVYGDSTLLVLNGTSLNSDSALLALNWQIMQLCVIVINAYNVSISAVVDKRYVNKIGDKTASFWKYMSTKILFCQHKSELFWKRKDE